MKRFLSIFCLGILLLSCSKGRSVTESEFRVELTYLGGSRVRITVGAMNIKSYYSYLQLSSQEDYFSAPAEEAIANSVRFWEESLPYYERGSFTDIFCYRGSRLFSITGIRPDSDYRFILFQIHPKTHKLIGKPIELFYHTRPIPSRDLGFEVSFEESRIHITPSDNSLSYFWDYESSEIIRDKYFFPQEYLYKLVEMYSEYGFLDGELSKGRDFWDLDQDDKLTPETEYTLVIAGCEDDEFTTHPMQLRFIWHGPGEVEVVGELEPCGINI